MYVCNAGQSKDPGMSFTRHPQPIAAPLDDDVNFECSMNLPAERFVWKHRPLNSDKWVSLTHTPSSNGNAKTSRHNVNFDQPSKAGDYRCVAFYGKPILLSIATTPIEPRN